MKLWKRHVACFRARKKIPIGSHATSVFGQTSNRLEAKTSAAQKLFSNIHTLFGGRKKKILHQTLKLVFSCFSVQCTKWINFSWRFFSLRSHPHPLKSSKARDGKVWVWEGNKNISRHSETRPPNKKRKNCELVCVWLKPIIVSWKHFCDSTAVSCAKAVINKSFLEWRGNRAARPKKIESLAKSFELL